MSLVGNWIRGLLGLPKPIALPKKEPPVQMDDFDQALKWVLEDEGGYSNDPADHGGATMWGVTQRNYDAWREEQKMPKRSVRMLTEAECRAIYYEEYWQPWCPTLPKGVDYVFFDMAVNAGPFAAAKNLQRALGVAVDGHIGPITRKALRSAQPLLVVARMSDARRAFYRSLHQARFLRGWLSRVDRVENRARGMLA